VHKFTAVFIFLVCIVSLSSLTFYGYSDSFIIDTANPIVTLLSPDGGETWYSGQTNSISWTALDSNLESNSVSVDFSIDAGLNWQSASGNPLEAGQLDWLVPALQTNCAMVRITVQDDFGNQGQDMSDNFFNIVTPNPASPQNVRIVLLNETDVKLAWDAVTTDVNGNPFTPDGYLVLCSRSPFGTEQVTLLAVTREIEYVHANVAGNLSRMFYCVLAYSGEAPQPSQTGNSDEKDITK
jgi:hypothetical protein